MARSDMDPWAWFNDFERRLRVSGDHERLRMFDLYHAGWDMRQKNPEQAFALYQQGARLAQTLGEPCMELLLENRMTETRITYQSRFREGLDLAVQLVTKASQARYAPCLTLPWVYITLILAYYIVDALTYETQIREMIEYMENEMPLDIDTHRRLQGYRARLEIETGSLDDAQQHALRYLAMSEGEDYRKIDAYWLLTRISFDQHQYRKTLEYAMLREEKARLLGDMMAVSASQLWQALMLRQQGDENEARRLFKQALMQRSTLGAAKNQEYYDLVTRFYAAGREYDQLLAVRDEQIATITEPHWLATVHYKRCVLLKKLNRLTPADLKAARRAVSGLEGEETFLNDLVKLQAPDVPKIIAWFHRLFIKGN